MVTQANEAPALLTVAEVADRLRVYPGMIHKKIGDGTLPALKLTTSGRGAIRIREDELELWLEREATL